MVCRLSKAVLLVRNGKLLLRIAVVAKPNRMVLQLPHGLNIQSGVRFQIDKNPARIVPFVTSTQKGIFAKTAISDQLLQSLRTGKNISITLSVLGGKNIVVPVSLAGFDIAFDKLK